MKYLRTLLPLLLFSALNLLAQENFYVASHSAALVAGTDKVTVQQPSTGAKQVKLHGALVSCSTAATTPCTLTFTQNGAAATATTLAVTPLNLSPPASSTAWSSSNVGAGTTVHVYTITAPGDYWLDLSFFTLAPGPNSNVSLGWSSVTATVSTAIFYTEM